MQFSLPFRLGKYYHCSLLPPYQLPSILPFQFPSNYRLPTPQFPIPSSSPPPTVWPIPYPNHRNMAVIAVNENESVGTHLMAMTDIKADTVIVSETGSLQLDCKLNTIQFKANLHTSMPIDGMIWRIQHMCDPNCELLFDKSALMETDAGESVKLNLIARKDIKQGEHLGYNYNTTEVFLYRGFNCACGAPFCHQYVRGFKFLSNAQQNDLPHLLNGGEELFSPAVQELRRSQKLADDQFET